MRPDKGRRILPPVSTAGVGANRVRGSRIVVRTHSEDFLKRIGCDHIGVRISLPDYSLGVQILRMTQIADGPTGEKCDVVCPRDLTFSFNHEQCLAAIARFTALVRSNPERIVLDLRAVERVNLGAGAVLMALAREARENGIKIDVLLPAATEMQERLTVCGLANILEDAGSAKLPESAILALDRLPREPEWEDAELERQSASQTDRVETKLDSWLRENKYELDRKVKSKFLQLVSETLENAIYHSKLGWWICASVQNSNEGIPLLEVAVFNFGGSLAESVAMSPEGSQTQADLASLRQEHTRKGTFSPAWTEENLRSLFAIQDGSSRYGEEAERGGGTHEIVKIFQFISDVANNHADCRLGWVSGSTAIFLDGRYRLGPSKIPSRAHRADIAFNNPNDLYEAPDRVSVVNLQDPFPGTLLKLQFPLRDVYLLKKKV